MANYNNVEIVYVGEMPGYKAKGIVKVGKQKYEVLENTMQKFKNRMGKEAIEELECFAIDVLVTHKMKNDSYFRKI